MTSKLGLLPLGFWLTASVVVGLCIGSFINVVVYRLPRGLNLAFPGSACPKCKKSLAWFDNIPIISWLILRARCRYCGLPISVQYPIVEALTGLVWGMITFTAYQQQWLPIQLLFILAISTILVVIAIIDFQTFLVPEMPPLLATVLAMLYVMLGYNHLHEASVGGFAATLGNCPLKLQGLSLCMTAASAKFALGGAAVLVLPFYLMALFKLKGDGDWLIALPLAIIAGWKFSLLILFLSVFTGVLQAVCIIVRRGLKGKRTLGKRIPLPYGPHLALAGIVTFLWGPQILTAYLKITGLMH